MNFKLIPLVLALAACAAPPTEEVARETEPQNIGAATLLTSDTLIAESDSEHAFPVIFQAGEQVVLMPRAPWHERNQTVAQASEISDASGASGTGHLVTRREMIRKGDSFDDWSELYALMIERPLEGELQNYVNAIWVSYQNDCVDIAIQRSSLTGDDEELFSILCEAEKANPTRGEVAYFYMVLREGTLARLYQNVRVPAFDISQGETGLPQDKIFARLTELSGLKIHNMADIEAAQ